jgi:3-oxoacyl-[acyl-carrier-protein] synthase III
VVMGGPGDDFYFRQDGKQVYRFVVTVLSRMLDRLLEVTGAPLDRHTHIITHQANLRMLQSVADSKKIPMERFHNTIEKFGNTSSASVGLTLDDAWRQNRFQPGDRIFLIAFGGGLSWAAAALRW